MKRNNIAFCCGAALLLTYCFSCEPVVKMGTSQFIGGSYVFLDSEVNEYTGIPYAEPPVGYLRFKKPIPISDYPTKFYANSVPPACHQYSKHAFPWYINSTDKSEDCLYLNIWTPSDASPVNKKAVMYWIYGGGFRYGSIRSPLYSGVALVAAGDIIVVTVNYRLGPFGFLTSGTEDAPGNVALWDILEGLRWVNRNIGYFGGDASKITIAGESVGSISVGLFAVSPLSQGLFSRQIMESGAPAYLTADNNTQNIALSQQIAKMVGCADDDFTIQDHPEPVIDCLKSIDAVNLSKAEFRIQPQGGYVFQPQYGDEILPMNPKKAIFERSFRCTDLLIGNNKDEGSFHVATNYPKMFGFFGEKNTRISKTTGAYMIREMFKTFPDTETVVQHYLPDNVSEYSYDLIRYQVYTSWGDRNFLCPDVYHAEKCAEKGGNVYFYFWTHRPSTTPWAPWMGAAHFSEVQFVFGEPLLHPYRYQEDELPISEQLLEIWSSFVKTGKPGIEWPLYSRKKNCFKYLGPGTENGRNGKGPHRKNCDFFRPFITVI